MNLSLEYKKIKRTGFFTLFLIGSIFTAAIPVINMAVRSEIYQRQQGDPIQILLRANWQTMAMLNILLIISETCLLYHTEYADNAMQKMKSLPIQESSIFFGKVALTILISIIILAIEAAAITACSYYWFPVGNDFFGELCKNFGYLFLLMLPCIILSLIISEACKNMWVSLGILVVCVFTATILPTNNFMLSLFPFAMPFQILANSDITQVMHYIYAALAMFIILCFTELLLIKVRRSFA